MSAMIVGYSSREEVEGYVTAGVIRDGLLFPYSGRDGPYLSYDYVVSMVWR